MISALVVTRSHPDAPDLAADLQAVGIEVRAALSCDNLVQNLVREAVRHAPEVVVCWEPLPAEPLFQALALLQSGFARPVAVFTQDAQAEPLQRALDCGVNAWEVQGYERHRLRPVLQMAIARFEHERRLREALHEATERYEERKLVDRAKGILMRAQPMPEDDAFRLLRATSMQGKQRVGQLAQQVIEAARQADALNRAGALRMLSQRLVKLQALRVAGVDAAAAQALGAQSIARAQEQIQHLQRNVSSATFGDLLQAVMKDFTALSAVLAAPPSTTTLRDADELAERWLGAADRLTGALESAGTAATLHVINVAGRQRMLSQRLAKQALLRELLPASAGGAGDGCAETARGFEQALTYLKQAPLTTPEIRAALEQADGEWQRMLQGVRAAGQTTGRLELAQASEALLALFEQLTERYEHSMQVLMGPALRGKEARAA